MHFPSHISRFFLLVVLLTSGICLHAQQPNIQQLDGVLSISLASEEAPLANFGEITPGTYVRQTFEARNNSEQKVVLKRVLTDPGCMAIGRGNNLRDIELAPGESVRFDLMSNVQVPQDYSFSVTSVLEIDGKRYRRAVFQWLGAVVNK